MVKLILRKLGIIPKPTGKLIKPSNLPYHLIRIENSVILAASLYYYFVVLKASWILFLVLLIAPDLALFGYIFGQKAGAALYDLVHIYPAPGILIALSLILSTPFLMHLALIWIAHIAQDRMRGFGLKYTDDFEKSHLHSL